MQSVDARLCAAARLYERLSTPRGTAAATRRMQELVEAELTPLLLVVALWHCTRLVSVRVKVRRGQVKIICETGSGESAYGVAMGWRVRARCERRGGAW